MSEQRRVVETRLTAEEAYKKCFKRAGQLGLEIKTNIPNERLEVRRTKRTGLWWTAVIVGLCFYVIPGVLVAVLWKQADSCSLVFDAGDKGGTTVTGQVNGSGDAGMGFFNEISGLLI
jgi:hypothetical protein